VRSLALQISLPWSRAPRVAWARAGSGQTRGKRKKLPRNTKQKSGLSFLPLKALSLLPTICFATNAAILDLCSSQQSNENSAQQPLQQESAHMEN
jgi:hypothetical protein